MSLGLKKGTMMRMMNLTNERLWDASELLENNKTDSIFYFVQN